MDIVYLDGDILNKDSRPGKGPIPCDIVFVGIAPSPNRPLSRSNEPFGAASWNMLAKIKRILNEPIYATNVIKTPLSSKKKPRVREIRYFYPKLISELKLVQPKKILALGSLPSQLLCPGFDSLREDHGTYFHNPELDCYVVPTYHFSAIGRDPSKIDLLIRDLERFQKLTQINFPGFNLNETFTLSPEKSYKIYLDLETTSLDKRSGSIISIGIGIYDLNGMGECEVYIYEKPNSEFLSLLYDRFDSFRNCVLVGHNLRFDLDWLKYFSDRPWPLLPHEDTLYLAHIAGEEVLALKHLTTMYTDRPGSRALGGPNDLGYLAEDVYSTFEVERHFREYISNYAYKVLNGLLPYFISMENNGVKIDRRLLEEILIRYKKEVDECLYHLGDSINWNSHQQVANYLLEHGVPLTEKTDKGNYSVKESVLKDLAEKYPIANEIMLLREKIKELEFLSSYYSKTSDEHPYLHPRLKPTGTRTGRLSCEDPNVQQVKRTGPIKQLFVSRFKDGYIGLVDLSQAELRVAALLSEDEEFANTILSEDPHRMIASMAFGVPPEEISAIQRKKSKAITFGLLYGGSPQGLANRSMLPVQAVDQILARIFNKFPKLNKYIERTKKVGVSTQEIYTLFGKRRSLRSIILTAGERDAGRKAINTPIQGTASEITLFLMLEMSENIRLQRLKSMVIFGVHDSILLDIHPDEVKRIQLIAQRAYLSLSSTPLKKLKLYNKLPIVGELIIGRSWANVESTNESYDPDHNIVTPCSSLDLSVYRGGVTSEREEYSEEEEEEEDFAVEGFD